MIVKCNETHRERVLAYLNRDRAINLFFIGDIENAGFDSSYCSVYIDDEEEIHTLYLTYRNNVCVASYENTLNEEFVQELIEKVDARCLSGTESLLEKYEFATLPTHEDCYFAKMDTINEMIDTSKVEYWKEEDIEGIFELQMECFPNTADEKELEELRNKYLTHAGRTYLIKEDGKVVASATTTAECTGLAMVVGVCTSAAYRGKGYASMCITKLSNELIREGRICCLFYNNPSAGRIYKALGYKDIGRWSMRQKRK